MKYFSCRSSRKIKKPNTRVHSNRTISLKLSCHKKSHRSSNCDLRTIKHKFDQVVILCFLIKEKRYTVFHNNYTSQNDNQQIKTFDSQAKILLFCAQCWLATMYVITDLYDNKKNSFAFMKLKYTSCKSNLIKLCSSCCVTRSKIKIHFY